MYEDQEDSFKRIFAYFHQALNGLFDFLNTKNASNKHYNADASRELISVIQKYEDLEFSLKQAGTEILMNDSYKKLIEVCKKFLVSSGGSPIPDDFSRINIIRYESIFELPNRTIRVTRANQKCELTVIGQGAFSIVQKYRDPNYEKFFAVKQAKKNLHSREIARFKREFEILRKLNFPYVLEVYVYDHEKNSYSMEYCDATLHEYIDKNNQKLSFTHRKKLALQFLYGINYLHANDLLHRDISFNNILIKLFDNGAAIVKLSDFGLVKEKESLFTKNDTEIKGTIIDPYLENFKDYNCQNEVYAVGVILLFIFTGKKNLKSGKNGIFKVVDKCTDRLVSNRYSEIIEIINDIDLLQDYE